MDRRTIIITATITVVITGLFTLLSAGGGGFASNAGAADTAGTGGFEHKLTGPILIHLFTAALAALLGPFILFRRKGDRTHRILGRIWAVLMIVTAISSAFIRTPGAGIAGSGFSLIHIFTVWTFINVPLGVWAARTNRTRMHRGMMVGLYIGLLVAGAFTFIPGRLLGNLVFGL
ncbi:MAG: DUF2306 domain-containing protein [Pseudomonadota bacterium]